MELISCKQIAFYLLGGDNFNAIAWPVDKFNIVALQPGADDIHVIADDPRAERGFFSQFIKRAFAVRVEQRTDDILLADIDLGCALSH